MKRNNFSCFYIVRGAASVCASIHNVIVLNILGAISFNSFVYKPSQSRPFFYIWYLFTYFFFQLQIQSEKIRIVGSFRYVLWDIYFQASHFQRPILVRYWFKCISIWFIVHSVLFLLSDERQTDMFPNTKYHVFLFCYMLWDFFQVVCIQVK